MHTLSLQRSWRRPRQPRPDRASWGWAHARFAPHPTLPLLALASPLPACMAGKRHVRRSLTRRSTCLTPHTASLALVCAFAIPPCPLARFSRGRGAGAGCRRPMHPSRCQNGRRVRHAVIRPRIAPPTALPPQTHGHTCRQGDANHTNVTSSGHIRPSRRPFACQTIPISCQMSERLADLLTPPSLASDCPYTAP